MTLCLLAPPDMMRPRASSIIGSHQERPTLKATHHTLPSSRWTSSREWDIPGYKERLESFVANVNREALLAHLFELTGQHCTISSAYSAGQWRCCFEAVTENHDVYIVRAVLPPHPYYPVAPSMVSLRTENEIDALRWVASHTDIPVPDIYAHENPGSDRALAAGAEYMIMEALHGNTIKDISHDLTAFNDQQLRKLLGQWAGLVISATSTQFEKIGALKPRIPSLCEPGPVTFDFGPVVTDEAVTVRPLTDGYQYFLTLAEGKLQRALRLPRMVAKQHRFVQLAPFILVDVVKNSDLFTQHRDGPFPLFHMDIGVHNIMVDDDLNIVSLIDWELAHTAPWIADYFPYPFEPILHPRKDDILADAKHPQHESMARVDKLQKMFTEELREKEAATIASGVDLPVLMSDMLNSPSSAAYHILERAGKLDPVDEAANMRALVRLAWGFSDSEAEKYFRTKESELRDLLRDLRSLSSL